MSELPVRKSIRLQEHDYSQNGAYFVTICVKGKRSLLGTIDVGANCVRPRLSEIGEIIENEIKRADSIYNGVTVDAYVVMPNHIHMILTVLLEGGRTQFTPTVSRVIKQFKGSITKRIGFSIWHRSFHDHIIRNEADYRRVRQYIDENPAKWHEDQYFVSEN